MFVFQGVFFRTFYTSRTIKNVKSEISVLQNKSEFNSIETEELLFSRNTQTITSLIPVNQLKDNIEYLDLLIIKVTTSNHDVYSILVPKNEAADFQVGQSVISTSINIDSNYYIPLYLSLDNESLIHSSIDSTDTFLSEYADSIDTSQQVQINGTITTIKNNTDDNLPINSIISEEIMNIFSGNYVTSVEFTNGNYYFTNSLSSRTPNLVFTSNIDVDGENYLIISVYQMTHIDDIVNAAGTANLYMFIVVLIILLVSSFIYSREFSRPLIFINRATKELSKMNFENPLIKIDSTDEFAELARNINILSVNLKTNIHRLNDQNKQLSDSLMLENKREEERSEFVRGMSHELKTPLAIIQASAEALEQNIYDNKKDQDEALQLIQKEVSRTNEMIKSMIEVYKVNTPNYQQVWKQENLKEIVSEVNNSLRMLYTNSKLEVDLDLHDTYVLCHRDKIDTVVSNLFTNAIKYTPEGGKITLSVIEDKLFSYFVITNNGISLSKEQQENIFEPFYRVDKSRSRKNGSTGLGLYIVQQTLEQHNSICTVKSNANSVTFTFKLKKVLNPLD